MKYSEIKKELKSGVYRPVYFLMGEEAFFIDDLVHFIEKNALPEDQRSFNQSILYGRDVDVQTVIGEAKRYPMMSERVVVIVKEAQLLRKIEDLQSYLEQPLESTILVIAYKYKKLDKRKKITKVLSNQHVLFDSKKLYDNQVPAWVDTYLREKGYQSNLKARTLIADSLGTDLGRIASELNKLELVVQPGGVIDEHMVENHIGISKDYNNFELNKALAEKDFLKAMKIQQYFAANPKDNPLVMTVSILYNFFTKVMIMHQAKDKSPKGLASLLKVNPFFVKDYQTAGNHYNLKQLARIIAYLREADRHSKGVGSANTSDGEILKELLFKIVYA